LEVARLETYASGRFTSRHGASVVDEPASLERAMSLVKKGVSVFGESDLLLTVEALIHQQYVNLCLARLETIPVSFRKRGFALPGRRTESSLRAAQLILGLVAHQSARPAEALACFKQAP